MTTIIRPRLPKPIDGSTQTFSPLEKRLRRADPSVYVRVEAQRVLRGDLKQRADQWNAADSLSGLFVRADGGLELARSLGALISNGTHNSYYTDLDAATPLFACRVE